MRISTRAVGITFQVARARELIAFGIKVHRMRGVGEYDTGKAPQGTRVWGIRAGHVLVVALLTCEEGAGGSDFSAQQIRRQDLGG